MHRCFFLTFEFGKVFVSPRKIQIMKKLFLLFLAGTFSIAIQAQEPAAETSLSQKQVPSVKLVDMRGKAINTAELTANGPVIISFWATWCAPCKKELMAIHDLYEEWQTETGVNLVAVSIDDEKTKRDVITYVNGKAWDYTVLLDPNGDFKRSMGVNNVPHTFLLDKNGNIVYTHNNYAPGDEEKLYEEIKKLTSE